MEKEQIKQYLENLAKDCPNFIKSRLKEGDLVDRYKIDDINLHKQLGDFPKGSVPYAAIRNKLKGSWIDRNKITCKYEKDIPFSDMLKNETGVCLEKAIMVQLAAQEGRDSYLIDGYMADKSDNYTLGIPHGYNVIFKDDKPYVVDAENPIRAEGKEIPYIVPIIDIEKNKIIVSDECKHEREYFLF